MENLIFLINSALSKELQSLIYILGYYAQQKQFKAYAVGGFVRDLLLGRENRDIDLVIEGSAIEFAQSLLKIIPGNLKCFERFGTATLTLANGICLDMVTARKEFYPSPGALPTVEPSVLKNDLFRRDFTINTLALALNPQDFGRLFDYFGGREDLKNKLIRVLYKLSFVDDPLRIIRAIRFEQRLNFTLEEETFSLLLKAIKNKLWEKVSKERLYYEVKLIFREPKPSLVLNRLDNLKMFNEIFPRLIYTTQIGSRLEKLEELLLKSPFKERSKKLNSLILFLSALFYDLPEHNIKFLFHLMRLRKKERLAIFSIREKVPLILLRLNKEKINAADLYFLLQDLPEEGLLLVLLLASKPSFHEQILFYWEHLKEKKPSLTGKDLLEYGLKPGPVFNQILVELHRAVLENKVKGEEEERKLVELLINRHGGSAATKTDENDLA